jgi:hypothetical protein
LVINGNHVKVLVNTVSMVALVTRMNIQASKSYGVRVKAHYGGPLWDVTLYYFARMCMFECILFQNFEIFSQYFCLLY